MKFLIVVAVCISAIAVEAKVKTLLENDRPNYPDVDYYDCTGRHETMEPHPFDCTRFIKCDNGRAQDMACPKCHLDGETCPNGYLHWDDLNQKCNWGDLAVCHGNVPTNSPVDPTSESSNECDEDCKEEGDCQDYKVCEGGHWAGHKCEAETWWNPTASPHGGACDFWDNLTDDQQSKYRDDPQCPAPELPCYWRGDEVCDNKYYWLDVGHKTNKSEEHLACPKSPVGVSLVWNQVRKGCVHCNPEGSCNIC